MSPIRLTFTLGLALCISACMDGGQDTTSEQPLSLPADTSSTMPTPTGALRPPESPPETARFCTGIGCESILTVELTEVDIEPHQAYTVDICLDGGCVSETITIDVPHPGTGEIIRGESDRPQRSLEDRA